MDNKVKETRKLRNMTIKELSEACGVPISTISDIERGAEPRVFTAIVIARALNVSVEQLWFV